jgi:hypothetical protein
LVALQLKQSAPLEPHREVVVLGLATQLLPSQQPLQFDWPSQMQLPAPVELQRCPAAQKALFLQRQTPLLQRSPRSEQSTHAAPPSPQLSMSEGKQTPPLQQPLGQVLALHGGPQAPPSQRQDPPTHTPGVAQAALLPQEHCPANEQLSARVGLQTVQAPPSRPQVAADGV